MEDLEVSYFLRLQEGFSQLLFFGIANWGFVVEDAKVGQEAQEESKKGNVPEGTKESGTGMSEVVIPESISIQRNCA